MVINVRCLDYLYDRNSLKKKGKSTLLGKFPANPSISENNFVTKLPTRQKQG